MITDNKVANHSYTKFVFGGNKRFPKRSKVLPIVIVFNDGSNNISDQHFRELDFYV